MVDETFSWFDKEKFELFVGYSKRFGFGERQLFMEESAFETDEDYKKVHMKDAGQIMEVSGERQVNWKPPSVDKYKINWDAAIDSAMAYGDQAYCERSQGFHDYS